jgi:hypothetical protein
MKPIDSSSSSDSRTKKRVRFEDNVQVQATDDNSPDSKEDGDCKNENYESFLTSGETDNGSYPVVLRTMLAHSIDSEPSSKRKREPVRVPPRVSSLSHYVRPPISDCLPSQPSRKLQYPVGLFSESQPIRSGGVVDIINSALDCIGDIESSGTSDQ